MFDDDGPPLAKPTKTHPGTVDKIEVLGKRYQKGLSLFNPEDEQQLGMRELKNKFTANQDAGYTPMDYRERTIYSIYPSHR